VSEGQGSRLQPQVAKNLSDQAIWDLGIGSKMGSAGVEPGVQQEQQQQQKQQARAATVELGKMDDDDGCGRGSGDGAQAWPRPGADLDEARGARGARGQKKHAEEAKAEDGLVNGDGGELRSFLCSFYSCLFLPFASCPLPLARPFIPFKRQESCSEKENYCTGRECERIQGLHLGY
jgi:hypothetical protein